MDGTARIVIIGNGFDLHYNIASDTVSKSVSELR